MRRSRQFPWLRRLLQEVSLSVNDLIWPVFIIEEHLTDQEIPAMPGVRRFSIDQLVHAAREAAALGIPCIAPFPFTASSHRTERGEESLNPNNLICCAIRAIKESVPNIGIMSDVALDIYTSHGHDGVVDGKRILNDQTVEILCQQAINQASAGADLIAPSDMMDGRIGAIRCELDRNGFQDVLIVSYAVKYASAFYSPFRNAVGSNDCLKGNKRTYQMNSANSDEALHEASLDLAEGADIIMVKPGMPCLDICWRLKDAFGMPTFAYQTSGEYAMIQAAACESWIDLDPVVMESLLAFKRAGCDAILTYFAPIAAQILREQTRQD